MDYEHARTVMAAAAAGDARAKKLVPVTKRAMTKLSKQGDLQAQELLAGIALEYDKDYKNAHQLFSKCAEQGSAPALRSLGHMYAQGLGVKKDVTQAAEYLDRASQLGDGGAQFNLALLLLQDNELEQDLDRAKQLLEQAQAAGIPAAGELLTKLDLA